jgi:hypothetical protein
MRRATESYGWIEAEGVGVVGLSLGYDRCAEHEWGIAGILSAFGIMLPEFPMGVKDRAATQASERLVFLEGAHKLRDKRRKGYPVAVLALLDFEWVESELSASKLASRCEAEFYNEPGDKWHKSEHDIATSWDSRGFCIQVRGAENIERLKKLAKALKDKDLSIGTPWVKSFFRGGVGLVQTSLMPQKDMDDVLAQDAAHKELHEAAAATGIHAILKAANKQFNALSPDWIDREAKEEVYFFLNPASDAAANFGWFDVEELKAWCKGEGPVVKDARLDAIKCLPDHYDLSVRLLRGLNAAGIHLRCHERIVWADGAKSVPGIKIRVTKATQSLLASGVYVLEDFVKKWAEPLQAKKEEAQTRAN